jgi:transcriptional antiterminator RfaH
MSEWLVVHTQPAAEARAEHHLRRQGYEVYCPRYAKTRRHARRMERVIRALFPRYLFVAFERESTPWHAIKSTVGVSGLVQEGERPLIARQDIIAAIRQRETEEGLVRLADCASFRPGQQVRVTGGPLSDQTALFECSDDRERAVVLLTLLGRQVRARLPVETLTAVN